MATQINFSFYKGEDIAITTSVQPVTDITGWTIFFTLRQRYGQPVLISQLATSSAPATSIFTVTVSSQMTLFLQPGIYVYDIQRTDPNHQTVLTIGYLQIKPEVLN